LREKIRYTLSLVTSKKIVFCNNNSLFPSLPPWSKDCSKVRYKRNVPDPGQMQEDWWWLTQILRQWVLGYQWHKEDYCPQQTWAQESLENNAILCVSFPASCYFLLGVVIFLMLPLDCFFANLLSWSGTFLAEAYWDLRPSW
jgi:hypothetical protein